LPVLLLRSSVVWRSVPPRSSRTETAERLKAGVPLLWPKLLGPKLCPTPRHGRRVFGRGRRQLSTDRRGV